MSEATELFNQEMENELAEQLIRICVIHGLEPDLFDTDDSQMYCMIKMATAINDNFKGKQIVSEKAISWLHDNHNEAYNGFYERL